MPPACLPATRVQERCWGGVGLPTRAEPDAIAIGVGPILCMVGVLRKIGVNLILAPNLQVLSLYKGLWYPLTLEVVKLVTPVILIPRGQKLFSLDSINNWFLSLVSLGETLVGLSKQSKKALIFTCFHIRSTTYFHLFSHYEYNSTPYLRGTVVPIAPNPLIRVVLNQK